MDRRVPARAVFARELFPHLPENVTGIQYSSEEIVERPDHTIPEQKQVTWNYNKIGEYAQNLQAGGSVLEEASK